MPTSSTDPSAHDSTHNWPNSSINNSFLDKNWPRRLELEDFEDDSFHAGSYVFERVHFMEEEEEVSHVVIPIHIFPAKFVDCNFDV